MKKTIGPGGMDCYRISHESGAEVLIASHGGHLISWKTADGKERLYLSQDADFSEGKAIRGGVPVIFPQFSDHGPFGRHGFARKSEWIADCDGGVLRLESSDMTRADWPFDFGLQLGVSLSSDELVIKLAIQNTGTEPFSFQAALHTYFKVDEVTQTKVQGLEPCSFENEVTKKVESATGAPISFGDEIDRSYTGAGDRPVWLLKNEDPLRIDTHGFPDLVVWNPGPSHDMGDLPTDGWKRFVCVESALVRNGEDLAPGEVWRGEQSISVD